MYPALAVLEALLNQSGKVSDWEGTPPAAIATGEDSQKPSVLWIGSVGGMEGDLVKRKGIPFEAIPAAGLHGVGIRALPGNLVQLGRGYYQARRLLRNFRPHAMLFTGGYVAVPMALAGRDIPSVVYVPDIEPGLALKFLARLADTIVVTAESSRRFFPHPSRVVVTGYPVRSELRAWNPEKARQALGLQDGLPTLLAFGGSKGARSINRALIAALPALLPEMQIVHISGNLDWPEVEAALKRLPDMPGVSQEMVQRYRPFPYLHNEMGAALAAADLAVSRAGASCLGEFTLFGLPAILVPYPYAWRYQQVNAEYLASKGAAEVVQDQDLPEALSSTVLGLMRDEARRRRMALAMRSLAKPDPAGAIAMLLTEAATHHGERT